MERDPFFCFVGRWSSLFVIIRHHSSSIINITTQVQISVDWRMPLCSYLCLRAQSRTRPLRSCLSPECRLMSGRRVCLVWSVEQVGWLLLWYQVGIVFVFSVVVFFPFFWEWSGNHMHFGKKKHWKNHKGYTLYSGLLHLIHLILIVILLDLEEMICTRDYISHLFAPDCNSFTRPSVRPSVLSVLWSVLDSGW